VVEVVTYTTKNPTLTILNRRRRQIRERPRNNPTIIESYITTNSSINYIAPFIIRANNS
jgi:hypothetical protein